jgi:hypothetical protein
MGFAVSIVITSCKYFGRVALDVHFKELSRSPQGRISGSRYMAELQKIPRAKLYSRN